MAIGQARLLHKLAWPADEVFAILAGWGNLTKVMPDAVKASELDETGYTRTLVTTDGSVLYERLRRYDAERRFQAYEILDTEDNGVPFLNYRARLSIRPLTGRSCLIDWSSRFHPKPDKTTLECRAFALMIYRGAVASAERMLAKR